VATLEKEQAVRERRAILKPTRTGFLWQNKTIDMKEECLGT
jgi:hypothetical protein